jgi:hypothetical protein
MTVVRIEFSHIRHARLFHVCACACACAHVCACVHMCVCARVCARACTCVCVCACVRVPRLQSLAVTAQISLSVSLSLPLPHSPRTHFLSFSSCRPLSFHFVCLFVWCLFVVVVQSPVHQVLCVLACVNASVGTHAAPCAAACLAACVAACSAAPCATSPHHRFVAQARSVHRTCCKCRVWATRLATHRLSHVASILPCHPLTCAVY